MTTLREAAQQALEALETWTPTFKIAIERKKEAITALKAALAEPQFTHSAECWRWHHECAVAEIERVHGIGIEARATLSSPRGSLGEEV